MKALVYIGPNAMEWRDAPEPTPGDDEVLVRVDAVGVCGSDMHAYHGHDGRRPALLILGHEAAGRIVDGADAGKRVAVNPLITCGVCDSCIDGRPHLCSSRQIISMPPRPGAFADLVRIPKRNLEPIPDRLSASQAALCEPLAVAYHAVNHGARLLARPLSPASCVVLGGGAIGLGAALVLAMQGARDIYVGEPNAARRRIVARSGDFMCYEPGGAVEPAAGTAALVIDAVGSTSTRAAAGRLARPGGVIVHVGLLPGSDGLDVRRITLQEITFTGTYCYTPVEFRDTLDAMVRGRLGVLDWYEERRLADGAGAFSDLDSGLVAAPKIIFRNS